MKPQVNIVVVVDVIGALSDGTLRNGNVMMVDDGALDSTGQGTPDLCTVVQPGQVVQWSALAVDLQTPVEIRNITFLGAEGNGSNGSNGGNGAAPGTSADGEKLDLETWTGVVPGYLAPGVAQKYRLELRMHEGEHSLLHIDSPALMCP
jgi:hypothetical protein